MFPVMDKYSLVRRDRATSFVGSAFDATKLTLLSLLVPGPVRDFMRERGAIGFGLSEDFDGRHLGDRSRARNRRGCAVRDLRPCGGEAGVGAGNALKRLGVGCWRGVVVGGASFDLLGVEDRIALRWWIWRSDSSPLASSVSSG